MSSSNTFYIGKGMRYPQIVATLQDADGVALNIQGKTVTFTMVPAPPSTAPVVTGSAQNLDDGTPELRGQVVYDWAGANDTAVAGRYRGYWEVVITGSDRERFPSDAGSYHWIEIAGP